MNEGTPKGMIDFDVTGSDREKSLRKLLEKICHITQDHMFFVQQDNNPDLASAVFHSIIALCSNDDPEKVTKWLKKHAPYAQNIRYTPTSNDDQSQINLKAA